MAEKVKYSLRNKTILQVALAIILPVIVLLLLYYLLVIPSLYNYILNEKKNQTLEMVDAGSSVLNHYYNLEQAGLLSREEAQSEASILIRSMRYGPNDQDYFWINDFEHQIVAHPFRPELEGQNLYSYQDQNGTLIFQEIVKICKEQGSGHIFYFWQYYDQADLFEEKLSYVAAFPPWDWIIGTGVYLKDLGSVIANLRAVSLYFLVIFMVLAIILGYLYYKNIHTRQELLESEEKYRLIAENTADTVSIIDLDLKFLYVSPSITNLLGFTVEEALERRVEETMTPESLAKAMAAFQQELNLIAEGTFDASKTVRLELEEYRKDGTTAWIDNSLSFIKDDSGQPIAMLSVAKDITERKKQHDKLQREQREKSLILDNITELVTYYDTEMRIVWANPAVLKSHGAIGAEIFGQKCYELWHGFCEPCPNCPVEEALRTGEICHNVVSYEDGRSWKMTGSPIKDEEGKIIGVLDTALDITELKKAEDELRILNEELEQRVHDRTVELERINRELAAFSYSVSHDLRAPLRSIEGFSEVLLEGYGDCLEEEGRNYLNRISQASRRMSHLIEDLLKLSRVTQKDLKFGQVDLSNLVEEYLHHLQETDHQREVIFNIEPGVTVSGDAALLRIAVENLLDNAWKFTAKINKASIAFGTEMQKGKKVYFIEDNGVGFSIINAEKIFDPFQRLHKRDDYPGTGIGLSIVQRIINRHNGRIWAESEPDKRTVFFFTLREH